jgi:thiol-disulfide isomerase/thioredoxin
VATIPSILQSQTTLSPKEIPAENPTSAVLAQALNALSEVKVVSYEIRSFPAHGEEANFETGTTSALTAIGGPVLFRARYESDSRKTVNLAVSDGETERTSDNGEIQESSARAMADRAAEDVLPTRAAFEPQIYRKALADHSALYAGQDDVEGDLCSIVAIPSLSPDGVGSKTSYLWISAKTGLPRAKQMLMIVEGKTLLTRKWVLSHIEVNPKVAPEMFLYHPVAADSRETENASAEATASHQEPTTATPPSMGMEIPEFDLRDDNYQPVSLPDALKGKATILTLWASWCASCIAEFPEFQRLVDEHPGQLQVIALGIEDSRLGISKFVKAHSQYKFRFLTATDSAQGEAAVEKFFPGVSVPRNVFIDAKGRIVEYHVAAYEGKEKELEAIVNHALAR